MGLIRVRWVHWCALLEGSLVRCVHSGALCWSSGLFVLVVFIRAHHLGRRFHSGSLRSLGRTVRIVWFVVFIQARSGGFRVHSGWVASGAPWGSSVYFGLIRARPEVRWVQLGCLGSFGRGLWVIEFHSGAPSWTFGRTLVVVVFIRAHPGLNLRSLRSFGRTLGVVVSLPWIVGVILVRLVHWTAPWESSGFVAFLRARPWGRRFHSCSLR